MIVICTDLSTFNAYALNQWPDPQKPGHWSAPWEKDSVTVVDGNMAAVRTLLTTLPSGLPDCIITFDTLQLAMAAYPTFPWYRLPAFSGYKTETCLRDAVQRNLATQE